MTCKDTDLEVWFSPGNLSYMLNACRVHYWGWGCKEQWYGDGPMSTELLRRDLARTLSHSLPQSR